jgi:hypothetical protein
MLEGTWRVEREPGLIPPVGVTKRIGPDGGWTLVGGLPIAYFRVRATTLDYLGCPIRDELVREADGTWAGRGLVFGRQFCRFRLLPTAEKV